MIVCKPKSSVLFSLGTFALLCWGYLFYFMLNHATTAEKPSYYYPIVMGLAGSALYLNFRMVFSYKVITAQKGQIEVQQKFLFRNRKFELRNLVDMDEVDIKTMNGNYCQLKLVFPDGVLKLSKQEYSDYDKLKSYVRQKWSGAKSSARR